MIQIITADSENDIKNVRELLLEYGRLRNFDAALGDYDLELANLPGEYSQPQGCLLLAFYHDKPAGCVAFRKIDDGICEMKRLYVKADFKGKKIGYALVHEIIKKAFETGYKIMRLDTHPWMKDAESLYRSLGFKEIEAYRYNPIKGAKFFELDLKEFRENNPL
jgi:GNAT superfamily N-acetyltransferase